MLSRHRCRSRNCCSVAAYEAIRQQHVILLNSSSPNLTSCYSPVVSTPRSVSPLAAKSNCCLHSTRESSTETFAEQKRQLNSTSTAQYSASANKKCSGGCSSNYDIPLAKRKEEARRYSQDLCIRNAMTTPIPYWNKAKALLSPEDNRPLQQSDGRLSAGNMVAATGTPSSSSMAQERSPQDDRPVRKKRWTLEQLRATDGIIPCQMGTNQFASQRGMKNFGAFRNTTVPVQVRGYKMEPVYIQDKGSDAVIPLQYGTNQFASQRGMTGFGAFRDVTGQHVHTMIEDNYPEAYRGSNDSYQHLPTVFHGSR